MIKSSSKNCDISDSYWHRIHVLKKKVMTINDQLIVLCLVYDVMHFSLVVTTTAQMCATYWQLALKTFQICFWWPLPIYWHIWLSILFFSGILCYLEAHNWGMQCMFACFFRKKYYHMESNARNIYCMESNKFWTKGKF